MTFSDDESPGTKKLDVISRQLSKIQDRLEFVEKQQGKLKAELSDLQTSEPKAAAPTVDESKTAYLEILVEQWAEKNNARLEDMSSKLMTTKEDLGGRIKSLEKFGQAFFEKAMEEKKERKMFEAKVNQRFMEELDPADADCNPEDVSKHEEQPPPELVGKEREAREAQYAALCERLERIECDAGKMSELLEENKRDLEKTGEEHEAKVAEVGTVVRRLSQNLDGHRASIEEIIDKTKERHGQAIGQVQEKLNETLTQIERLEKVERLAQNLKSDLSSEKKDRESLEARLGRELREIPHTVDSIQQEVRELRERVKSVGDTCSELQDSCDPDVMKRRFDKLQDRIDYLEKQAGSTQAKLHDLQAEGGNKNAPSMDDGKINYLEALIEQWVEKNTAALDEVKAKVFEEHRSYGKQSEKMESLEQLGKQMYTSMSGEKIAREQFQQRLEERMQSLEEHVGESPDGETTRDFTPTPQTACDVQEVKSLARLQESLQERLGNLELSITKQQPQSDGEEVKSLARLQESIQERLGKLELSITKQQSSAIPEELQSRLADLQSRLAKSQECIQERLDHLEKNVDQQSLQAVSNELKSHVAKVEGSIQERLESLKSSSIQDKSTGKVDLEAWEKRSVEWERRLDRMERQFCEQIHELVSMGSPSSKKELQDDKSPFASNTKAERRFSQLEQFVGQSVDGHDRRLTDLEVVFASLKDQLQSLSLSAEGHSTLHSVNRGPLLHEEYFPHSPTSPVPDGASLRPTKTSSVAAPKVGALHKTTPHKQAQPEQRHTINQGYPRGKSITAMPTSVSQPLKPSAKPPTKLPVRSTAAQPEARPTRSVSITTRPSTLGQRTPVSAPSTPVAKGYRPLGVPKLS